MKKSITDKDRLEWVANNLQSCHMTLSNAFVITWIDNQAYQHVTSGPEIENPVEGFKAAVVKIMKEEMK